MKIAINGLLLGGAITGVEVSIIELIEALKDCDKHQFVIYLPEYSNVTIKPAQNMIIKEIKIGRSRLSRIKWEHRELDRLAKADGCDIIHCPGYISPLKGDLPIVLTVHDCFAVNNPKWCKLTNRIYYKLALGRSIRNATSIITPSQYIKKNIVDTFNISSDNIFTVPFATPSIFEKSITNQHISSMKIRYSLPDKYILWIGNQEPKKNIKGVLSSYKKYITKVPSGHKLVLAGGKGWGGSSKKLIAKLKLENKVIMPGYIEPEYITALFRASSLYLFPSHSEGFGFPVLEAFKSNVPVITSYGGALPEVAGDAAMLFNHDSYDEIASGINDLLNNEAIRKEFIDRGIKQVAKFSWKETVKQTVKIYENSYETS